MDMRDFCFWLQGFFEINDKGPKQASYELTHQQIATIREHLNMVFKHVVGESVAHEIKPENETACATEAKPVQPDEDMKKILDKIMEQSEIQRKQQISDGLRPPFSTGWPKVYC